MDRGLKWSGRVALLLLLSGCATTGDRMVAAARAGNTRDLGALLEQGISPDAWGVDHQTPLMAAAQAGRTDAVRFLLAHGADVNATDWEEDTALIQASRNGHAEVVGVLLAHGAAVDARRWNEASVGSGSSVFAEPTRGFHRAGSDGPRPTRSPSDGETALMAAARNGHVATVRVLLDAGADPNLRNAWGDSALGLAWGAGRAGVVRTLAERGAAD
ncbi:MAG TPA: ankyrin repeat domain-containing protein [Deferrisomatales bacterium]|nr:ankyrin repeat domain-containing protein [Deferrisomatales bacterium]